MQFTLKIIPSMVHNTRTKTISVVVYLYSNEHIIIPRGTRGIYGSAVTKLLISENTSYRHNFYIKRDKVIEIDKAKPGYRCGTEGVRESVGQCYVRYMEDANNCTTYGLMGNKTKKICDKNAKNPVQTNWLEEEIFQLTGCLPNCERDVISLMPAPDGYAWPAMPGQQYVIIRLLYEDALYTLMEEYEDYDMSSFIADVGGFLGLLLGHSVLSIYYISVDLMMKLKDIKMKRSVFNL